MSAFFALILQPDPYLQGQLYWVERTSDGSTTYLHISFGKILLGNATSTMQQVYVIWDKSYRAPIDDYRMLRLPLP